MIYAIMGGEMLEQDTIYDDVTENHTSTGSPGGSIGANHSNWTATQPPRTDASISCVNYTDASSTTAIPASNISYIPADGIIMFLGVWNATDIQCSYSIDSTASQVINETVDELQSATDYFGIIITITAMVVLILLTVIIIRAIRGSGLIAGERGVPRETA